MSEDRPTARSTAQPPSVGRPPEFVDRRTSFRRAADRIAHRETVLLARSLDILASGGTPEARLAGILDLLARTAGARRAGVVAEGTERRVAVVAGATDMAEATAFAGWLDAAAQPSRARRAAAAPAPVLVARRTESTDAAGSAADTPEPGAPVREVLPIRGLPGVSLGFEFADAGAASALREMLPPTMARHAAVALALVTEQIGLEHELSDLRAASTERSRFVSTVAHELRTPLTGLSGYLDLILEGKVADADVEREFLERGRDIVRSMGELVGDLLELSRLEAGSLRLEVGPFSVAEAAGRVAASLHPIALERGIELTTELPPRLRVATGDRRRVEQIVTNLAANALKFTPSGRRVEIGAWFEGTIAIVAVRDEGPGIAPDDRARIFERFYRVRAQERVPGTGLGLAIARELARAMGGELGLASVPGSGSSFVLALPGPAPSDASAVPATLEDVLRAEEVGLEERAVLRAMQLSGRSGSRSA